MATATAKAAWEGQVGQKHSPKATSLRTDIWLVVRVPVLSEQMTVVQPRVSTEGSFLHTNP